MSKPKVVSVDDRQLHRMKINCPSARRRPDPVKDPHTEEISYQEAHIKTSASMPVADCGVATGVISTQEQSRTERVRYYNGASQQLQDGREQQIDILTYRHNVTPRSLIRARDIVFAHS